MSPKDPHIPPTLVRRIEVLAFPAVQLLDVAGPLQVFAAANERATEGGGIAPYLLSVVGPGSDRVRATAGLEFAIAPLPGLEEPVDTLIVAGGQGVMQAAENEQLQAWVRRRAACARRVASVCTGAFLLAAAGLLDGHRAVTHWAYCERLARRFPKVDVDADPIFIEDRFTWTSAGVTAGIDLSLALVEADLGRSAALDVARHLVVFLKRPGGQAQFSAALSLQSADDRFGKLNAWISDNLAEDLSLRRLADEAGMSERTLLRRYKQSVGQTPSNAVEQLRIETARRLLIETHLPLKRIAAQCGLGTEETLRRRFRRHQGVTPSEYRDRFSS